MSEWTKELEQPRLSVKKTPPPAGQQQYCTVSTLYFNKMQ